MHKMPEYINPDYPTDNTYGYLSTRHDNPAESFYYRGGGNPYGNPNSQYGTINGSQMINPFNQNTPMDSRRDIPMQPPMPPQNAYQLNGFIENSNPFGNRWDCPPNAPYSDNYRGYYGNYQNMMDGVTIPSFSKKNIWETGPDRPIYVQPMSIDWNAADKRNYGYDPYFDQHRSYVENPFGTTPPTTYSDRADSLFK